MQRSKREQIVETATRLFYLQGFHATRTDLIAREADVSKKTLYKHFANKSELILASLQYRDSVTRNQFRKSVSSSAKDPYDRLLSFFDTANVTFNARDFNGCMFINAVGEYSKPGTALRRACKEAKLLMRQYIKELVDEVAIVDSEQLSHDLALIFDGAIVAAQVSDPASSAAQVKRIAKLLIDDSLKKQASAI